MTYRTISVNKIAGALGAEISGVDLSRDLDDDVIGEIRHALVDNCVIFFREQNLTPGQHLDFGRRFGRVGGFGLCFTLGLRRFRAVCFF